MEKSDQPIYSFTLNKLVASGLAVLVIGGAIGYSLQKSQSMKSQAFGRGCNSLYQQLMLDVQDMLHDISRGIYPDEEGMTAIRAQAAEYSACTEALRVFQEQQNIAE